MKNIEIKNKTYTLWDAYFLTAKCVPFHAAFQWVTNIIGGILPSISIIVTTKFIDNAIAIASGKMAYNQISIPLAALIAITVYSRIISNFNRSQIQKMTMRMQEVFSMLVIEKKAKLKYEYIEDKKTADLLARISKKSAAYMLSVFKTINYIILLIFRTFSVVAVLFTQIWWAAIVIVIFSIPLVYLTIISGKSKYKTHRETEKYRRKAGYLSGLISGRDNVEERAVFGYSRDINEKWFKEYETARKLEQKVYIRNFIKVSSSNIMTALVIVGIAAVLLQPVISNAITVGLFIAIIEASNSLINSVRYGLVWELGHLTNLSEQMKDFSIFAKLEETPDAICQPSKTKHNLESVEFCDVSFKYPGTNKYILKNMSFKIEAGKHYSFVGINGAGKSTVTKLIIGLYTNYEGTILINGKDLLTYNQSDLKAIVSVVFQESARFSLSLRDTIAVGNINKINTKEMDEEVNEAIETMALGDTLKSLSDGFDTKLGRLADKSAELSGGQWQRIAMARSIVNPAPLKILDEPTAALDPVSESKIYEDFEKISRGSTTIYISHRLGSTKLADIIFVIDDGKIAESGSHQELMAKKGLYTEMFENQRSWYL